MHRLLLKITTSIIGVSAFVAHFFFHFSLDGIDVALLALALLPWLSPLVKSVEIAGVGKVELQELREKVQDARGAADSAANKADLALAGSPDAKPTAVAGDAGTRVALSNIAREYEQLRKTQKSGLARTSLMSQLVAKVIQLAPESADYDRRAALQSSKAGDRLVAYGLLYANPDPNLIDPLIESLAEIEVKAFSQYWAILALQKMLATAASRPSAESVSRLQMLKGRLGRGTDRYYELQRAFQQLEQT